MREGHYLIVARSLLTMPMWGSIIFFQGVETKNMKKKFGLILFSALSLCFFGENIFAQNLPSSVQAALQGQQLKASQLAASLVPLDGGSLSLAWHSRDKVPPASTEKVITTLAALELLGPHYQWTTDFSYTGRLEEGVLKGTLYIRGGGDPQYTVEDLWRDLGYLKSRGIYRIEGDIAIDRSLFHVTPDEGAFDRQADRPYNKEADAALLNYQTVSLKIEPDEQRGSALLTATPALAGLSYPREVKLLRAKGCWQWRQKLEADLEDPWTPAFDGGFPRECESKTYSYVIHDPVAYWQAALQPLLAQYDMIWQGRVIEGTAPAEALPLLRSYSDDLAVIVRLTNKFSNNVFARHLLLTVGYEAYGRSEPARYEMGREALGRWLADSVGIRPGEIYVENGSGLSRKSFVTPQAMTRLIAYGWRSPRMPDWITSFPISGMDGTMMKRPVATGSAYLKTGLLSQVKAVAGIIQAQSGHRYALFASVHGAKATYSDEPLDRLIEWVYRNG